MASYDKIRILYIDDREEDRPEKTLPKKLQNFFTISHPARSKYVESFKNADEFAPVIADFWFNRKKSVLPAEIIVMDYNLKKWMPAKASSASEEQEHSTLAKDLNPRGSIQNANVEDQTLQTATGKINLPT